MRRHGWGSRLTRGREGLALADVVVLGLAFFADAWVFGSVVAGQVDQVRSAAPASLRAVLDRLGGDPYGRPLLDQAQGLDIAGATGWAASVVTGTFGEIMRGLGGVAAAVFATTGAGGRRDRFGACAVASGTLVAQTVRPRGDWRAASGGGGFGGPGLRRRQRPDRHCLAVGRGSPAAET